MPLGEALSWSSAVGLKNVARAMSAKQLELIGVTTSGVGGTPLNCCCEHSDILLGLKHCDHALRGARHLADSGFYVDKNDEDTMGKPLPTVMQKEESDQAPGYALPNPQPVHVQNVHSHAAQNAVGHIENACRVLKVFDK